MLTSPLLVSSHSPRKVNKHHACTSSTPYSLQFAGNVLSTVKILLDLHIKPCVVFMLVKPYILIRSCRCKQATLQTLDASSNWWPSVEGELTQDLTSGLSLRGKFKRSSSRGGKISRTTVDKSVDVTDAGRMNKRTREDRATHPMDAGWLSFAMSILQTLMKKMNNVSNHVPEFISK